MKAATKYPDLFNALAKEFHPSDVKSRSQGGRQFSYITARTVMNRLDEVLGPENWWDRYGPAGAGGVLCKLTIRLPDGSLVTKCDAGGFAGMSDSGDDEKSGYSDALKRAAVRFGIGRYLYRDGQVRHAEEPTATATQPAPSDPPAQRREPEPEVPGAPRTGKGLFVWAKDLDARDDVQMLKYLTHWGKLQEYPTRMVEWDAEQVGLAYAEACRRLKQVGEFEHQAGEPAKAPGVRERSAAGKFDERDPTTGKSLFTWLKHHEEQYKIGPLVKFMQDWGRARKLPSRFGDWHESRIPEAVAEAKRFIAEALRRRGDQEARDAAAPAPYPDLPADHPWHAYRPPRDEPISPRMPADRDAYRHIAKCLSDDAARLRIDWRRIAEALLRPLAGWKPAVIACPADAPDEDLVSCLAIANRNWPEYFERMARGVLDGLRSGGTNAA